MAGDIFPSPEMREVLGDDPGWDSNDTTSLFLYVGLTIVLLDMIMGGHKSDFGKTGKS